jgi:type IX secretion system PorP/SprF family membrane protein
MRLLICLLIFLFPTLVIGQQNFMTDNFVHDALAINPAYAGSQEALSTTVYYRNYLTDFAGSPKTISLSVHTPLKKEKIGLGISFSNDKIGVSNETNLIGNYAYRMDMGTGKLSLGIGFGLTISTTNWADLAAVDEGDVELTQDNSTGALPNFSTGVYYSTHRYFVGISVPLLLTYSFDTSKDKYKASNNFSDYDYFLNTGYIFDIGKDIKFFPSLLLKYHKASASEADITTQLILKDKVWLGVGYQSNKSIVVMLQYQLNKQLRIAYSHDFMVGQDVPYHYSSQGFMINYVFNYNAQVAGPRQF